MARRSDHVITREIGNLKGFSTDSIFTRPPNVADKAINLQRAPDGTQQIRRGYQCQVAEIGGLGLGTLDDPNVNDIITVTVGLDGFLYKKLTKQIYFYYDGQITGDISGLTNANPAQVTSIAHGLLSGTHIIIRDVGGMVQINNKSYAIDVITANTFNLYNLANTGIISFADQTNPCQITSIAHGLTTGDMIMIQEVGGMVNLNNLSYTITVIDSDNFTLDGVDATAFPAYTSGGYWALSEDSTAFAVYTSGGTWSIAFADQRYLTFTIFTDPRFLTTNPGWSVAPWSFSPWGAPSGESITANITVNRAAQISGNQSNVNTVTVEFGHELAATDIIQFTSSNGVLNQRNVLAVTADTVTFDGFPVTVLDNTYINQFFDIPFRKGFDVTSPYLISTFIATITNPVTGIEGLEVSINGDDNYPAAFLQIFEPTIIPSNSVYTIDYWYWEQINSTINPPFPGSADLNYQNSPAFENASMAVFDDVIYIVNGKDYPQKYDGQTVYRTGIPAGTRPSVVDSAVVPLPFVTTNEYQYAITYEQIDNRGHIVEGEVSEIFKYTVVAANASGQVTVENLSSSIGNNWNTNGALAVAGTTTSYGPDVNGFFYDLVTLTPGFTLKIGDSAYYADTTCAVVNGAQANVFTITVDSGHGIVAGDRIYFEDSGNVMRNRLVASITDTTITILGDPVSVADNATILVYKVSLVFGNVAIVDGNQTATNVITVHANYPGAADDPTIQIGDVIEFIDTDGRLQRRTVLNVAATTVTIDGLAVDVSDLTLIASLNQRANALNFRRENANPITFAAGFLPISNNLRINIYRTDEGKSFGVDNKIKLVASIPNDSLNGTQNYIDHLTDVELGRDFDDPEFLPNPPPISKYVKAFGNQLFYAGGEVGNPDNSDNVFFSNGNRPEEVPLATNFFDVPNIDDDITGIGVAGTTLVVTKNQSLWAATGNFLSGNIEVVQIAPGTNIGCVAHATIASVGTLMYFVHTNGVYTITENQLFPTDAFGNPIPISLAINALFRETNFIPQNRFVFKRAVAINYTKDLQYLLFIPCEDVQSTIRTANANSVILQYDYQDKNWFLWYNMNAAGGFVVIRDDLYFQERRFSAVDGNTANLYKQHRFYRLIDHADHAGAQRAEWRSSWEDLGQPEVRKKFCRCVLLMDRISELQQFNNPELYFSSYVNRIPNLQSTIAKITTVDNIRNSSWSYSGWGWNYWSGYQDSFITVNLKQGTVAKSMQIGFTLQGINMDIRLAGFQLEIIPENRKSVLR